MLQMIYLHDLSVYACLIYHEDLRKIMNMYNVIVLSGILNVVTN
jgi:hypothetical protein